MEPNLVIGKRLYQPRMANGSSQKSGKPLLVKVVRGEEVLLKWKIPLGAFINPQESYYADCTLDGRVDWSKAEVYSAHHLVQMNNVQIVYPQENS